MALNLRVRGPSGQSTLSGVDASMSVADFQHLLAEKTGVPAGAQEVLAGFPPSPLDISATSGPLSALPIQSGDTLVVRAGSGAPVPPAAASAPPPAAAAAPASAPPPPAMAAAAAGGGDMGLGGVMVDGMDEDEAMARAIALSMMSPEEQRAAEAEALAATSGAPAPSGGGGGGAAAAAAEAPASGGAAFGDGGGDGGGMVRRVIDADNSCLFNAVGYVMDRTRAEAPALRKVIADAVKGDPFTYNDGFLGKENGEYCAWILDSQKWGGAIELSILASHYKREIWAYDIQTKRCDTYGAENEYAECVMLLYDGLHYDAMALSPFAGAPEEVDQTIFDLTSPDLGTIRASADSVVEEAHRSRQFTDMHSFTLRCLVCQCGLVGEKEAREHAMKTGHQNFSEY